MPTVAVQVVNYRTRRYLERCLATVAPDLEASGIDAELNLLDNASGEELGDLAAAYRNARAFESPRNLGFGAGHNLLASKTEAPYLLILNPDVEFLEERSARRLLAALEASSQIGAVGPKLIDGQGNAQRYDHGRLHGTRAQIALRGGNSYWRETSSRQDVAWVSGAAMLIRHAAFATAGGFDPELFLYKEEEDLCLRLRQAGHKIVYDPAIVVRHLGSVVADRSEALERSRRYFVSKHFGDRRSQRIYAAVHRRLGYLRI